MVRMSRLDFLDISDDRNGIAFKEFVVLDLDKQCWQPF